MIKSLPNIISCFRIFGTAVLIFTNPLSLAFYIMYTLCGMSDVLDGVIARATGNTTELGAKLDSIADILYYAVMLIRILPYLVRRLPIWIWYIVALVIILRLISYAIAAVKYRRFASLHTYMNKLTGALVFTVPYFFYGEAKFGFVISLSVCIVSGIAATEEIMIHFNAKHYDPNRKHFIKFSKQKQA